MKNVKSNKGISFDGVDDSLFKMDCQEKFCDKC